MGITGQSSRVNQNKEYRSKRYRRARVIEWLLCKEIAEDS